MPRLDPEKPLSRSVPELATFHLEAAITLLEEQRNGPHHAVHQARKSLKRLRALLRLVESADRKVLRAVRRNVSDAARHMSEFRDSTALVECAERLHVYLEARHAGDMSAPLREAVERRRDLLALETPASEKLVAPVIVACRKALKDIAGASFGRDDDAASIVAAGRQKNHDKARAILEACHHGGQPEAFHDLRKAAQTTLFQAGFLSDLWPFAFDAEANSAKSLTEVLGHEHDIEVLAHLLQSEPHLFGAIADKDRLASLLMERRAALRHDAMTVAADLYRQSGRKEAKRLVALWRLASGKRA